MKITLKDYKKLESDYKSLSEKVDNLEKDAETKIKEAHAASEKAIEDAKKAEEKYLNSYRTGMRSDSDEQKALMYFNCKGDVRNLFNVNTQDPAFAWVKPELKSMVVQLKKDLETARVISQLFYGDGFDRIGGTEKQDFAAKCNNITQSRFFKEVLEPKLKAFGTTVVGGGAEWIPTIVASNYITELELEREVVSMLRQITMPSGTYELPTASGLTKARRATEGITATESNFTTGKLELVAKKFLEYYIFPEELDEDSAPGIVELGRSELREAHIRAYEAAFINGTKFGTVHIDSDTQAGAADLAEKQWHGCRYYAIDNTANGATVDFGNAVVSDANLGLMRQRMGKFGVIPSDLVWITGATSYLQMTKTNNVVTVDKLGPNATVLKGQLGSYDGIPIVQTGYMRSDLNASGVYDGVTVDRTGLLLVHRKRLYFGTRRPIVMAIRPSRSADDRIEMASYSRVDFTPHAQGTSDQELTIVYGLNVAT